MGWGRKFEIRLILFRKTDICNLDYWKGGDVGSIAKGRSGCPDGSVSDGNLRHKPVP
jgi:hypothetical protein